MVWKEDWRRITQEEYGEEGEEGEEGREEEGGQRGGKGKRKNEGGLLKGRREE
jgi:hypothetical protein